MNSRFLGAIFLILGTCIGGSMLALPMTTASEGVYRTVVIMIASWLMMMVGALALLRVNLRLPENSNLISMSKATLGKAGEIATWIMTLFLLYTLLSAYISGGQDLLATLFDSFHINSPMWLNAVLFTMVLGVIVFKGIKLVDYVNRGLMSTKLLVCFILILLLIPFSSMKHLSFQHLGGVNSSAMCCITAFGYASIIPSIRSYLKSDSRKLHWAVFLGGFIPLVCYLAWIFAVQATVPTMDLNNVQATAHPLKNMIEMLIAQVNNRDIHILTNVFTSICVLTSFLGVALSLSDFLADGTKVKKVGKGLGINAVLTLIPPLLIVLLFPAIFLKALNYAGVLCVLLLFIMPIVMVIAQKIKEVPLVTQKSRVEG